MQTMSDHFSFISISFQLNSVCCALPSKHPRSKTFQILKLNLIGAFLAAVVFWIFMRIKIFQTQFKLLVWTVLKILLRLSKQAAASNPSSSCCGGYWRAQVSHLFCSSYLHLYGVTSRDPLLWIRAQYLTCRHAIFYSSALLVDWLENILFRLKDWSGREIFYICLLYERTALPFVLFWRMM